MRATWLLVLAACGSNAAPEPWTSGSIVKAREYVGVRALAARVDTKTGFICDVDPRRAPAFMNCPRTAPMLFSDPECTHQNLAEGWPDVFITGQTDAGPFTYKLGETWQDGGYMRVAGRCRTAQPFARMAMVVDAAQLRLGATTTHEYDGVEYEALETDDGFSVITAVTGGQEMVERGDGRIAARFVENGSVRKYVGMFDTLLETNCVATVMSDSTTRCVPESPPPVGLGTATCGGTQLIPFTSTPTTTVFEGRLVRCDVPTRLWDGHRGICYEFPNPYRCRDAPEGLAELEAKL
jgi:hypothetical protein